MQRFILAVISVLIITLAPIAVSADEQQPSDHNSDALSLTKALERTYTHNPTLRAARARLLAVQEQLPQALAGRRPTLSAEAGLSYGRVDALALNTFTSKEGSLSLVQPLYSGGTTLAQIKAANATINAQQELLDALEQEILLSAAVSYVDVVRDQALLNLSRNNRAVIARQSEATQDRFDVGELTLTDVSQSKARLARADSEIASVRGNLKASKAVFEQIIGLPAKKLVRPRFLLPIPASSDEAVERAELSSPVIRSAQFSYESSENDINGVYGELLPDLDLVGALSKAYDPSPGITNDSSSRSIGLVATIPLYKAGANRSRVREAKHTSNQRYIEVLEAKRLVRQQIVTAWEVLSAARAEIISRQAQVDASTVAQEGVREEANIGIRTVLDSLDADQELLDAQVALVTTRRNELVAQFALLAILGNLSPESLGFPAVKIDLSKNTHKISHELFDMHVDRVGTSH